VLATGISSSKLEERVCAGYSNCKCVNSVFWSRAKGSAISLTAPAQFILVHPISCFSLRDLVFEVSHCVFLLVIVDPKLSFGIRAGQLRS